jgi:hypothetical protein
MQSRTITRAAGGETLADPHGAVLGGGGEDRTAHRYRIPDAISQGASQLPSIMDLTAQTGLAVGTVPSTSS